LTPPALLGRDVQRRRLVWPEAWRIIASRYPPINLFERVTDNPAVWETLVELEQLTNPRIRDEAGEIALVPPARRIAGPNASWVMAAFTHVNKRGSRFSDGSYGVYYTAEALLTAIKETAFHWARFAADSHDPPGRREDMRVLLGSVDCSFCEVDTLSADDQRLVLDKSSYEASQAFGVTRREAGSDGISYPSVRDAGGRCVGAFWPNVVGIPIQERHLQYEWDGARVARYFDFKQSEWVAL
jgi:RES domain